METVNIRFDDDHNSGGRMGRGFALPKRLVFLCVLTLLSSVDARPQNLNDLASQAVAANNPPRQVAPPVLRSPNVAQPLSGPPQPPVTAHPPDEKQPKVPAVEFTGLLEVPRSCSAVREAGPKKFPHPPVDPLCASKRDCLFTLSAQINALINYLGARPLLRDELRKEPVPKGGAPYFFTSFDNLLENLQAAANASKFRKSIQPLDQFVCAEIEYNLDKYVFRVNERGALPRAFETFSTLAQNYLVKLQSDHEGDIA